MDLKTPNELNMHLGIALFFCSTVYYCEKFFQNHSICISPAPACTALLVRTKLKHNTRGYITRA